MYQINSFKRVVFPACLLALNAISNPLWGAILAENTPNFIIINCDDLGYGDLSCYGHPSIYTPHIDQMASNGIKCNSFYVSESVSSPSRAGLLTGRYGVRTGMYGNNRRVLFPNSPGGMPESEFTIPELLKEAGYNTACIGKWHLGSIPDFSPLKHGFDYFFGYPYSNDMSRIEQQKLGNENYPYLLSVYEQDQMVATEPDQRYITRDITHKAIDYIKKMADSKSPFFLYLAHPMPHFPVYASDSFTGKSRRGKYGDAVEEIDWSVGEIINTLKNLAIDKNTLVIFTSDNGPWLTVGDQGGSAGMLKDGKGSNYEGGFRVPCIIWGHSVKKGTLFDMISSLDLLPTCCDYAGVELPENRIFDGVSIRNVIQYHEKSNRNIFFFYRGSVLYAVRKGKYKLQLMHKSAYQNDSLCVFENPKLFDLEQDVEERFDIASQFPDIVNELVDTCRNFNLNLQIEKSIFDQ